MQLVILVGIALAVVALIAVVVSLTRSRSAKSDWLGELSEIRRSSLGDDEEVTGALQAVSVDEDDPAPGDDGSAVATPDDEGANRPVASSAPGELRQVVDRPDRTITDAGKLFREFDRPGAGLLRVEATDPDGLRVLVGSNDTAPRCAVDLPHGILWYRCASDAESGSCSVRTPAGWVLTGGTVLVLVESDWSYVMCLSGAANLRITDDRQVRLLDGQIGRIRLGAVEVEVAEVGAAALESEAVVRRQRRLDVSTSRDDRAAGGAPQSIPEEL